MYVAQTNKNTMQQSEHDGTMETNPSYAVHLFLGETLSPTRERRRKNGNVKEGETASSNVGNGKRSLAQRT
jgi:hypothetical protein